MIGRCISEIHVALSWLQCTQPPCVFMQVPACSPKRTEEKSYSCKRRKEKRNKMNCVYFGLWQLSQCWSNVLYIRNWLSSAHEKFGKQGCFAWSPKTLGESLANACSASSRYRWVLCWLCSLFPGNLRSLLASGSLLEMWWWAGISHQRSAVSAASSASQAWAGAPVGTWSRDCWEGKPQRSWIPQNAMRQRGGRLLPAAQESWEEWTLIQGAGNHSWWNKTKKDAKLRYPKSPHPPREAEKHREVSASCWSLCSICWSLFCSVWLWCFTSHLLKCQNTCRNAAACSRSHQPL